MAPVPADPASTRTDPRLESASTANRPQKSRQQSIKRRVVRLVLVPSVVALLLWFTASGYLVFQGFYNRTVAITVREVSIPAVTALSSIQQERRLSIAFLARPTPDLKPLLDQRQQTDDELVKLRAVADSALSAAPDSIQQRWRTLAGFLDQLPSTRTAIDARSTTDEQAYSFYNELLDAATSLFDDQARIVPDAVAAQGGITATELFRASDLMSRAASMMDGAFAANTFGNAEYLEFVRLVNAYHYQIDISRPQMEPLVRDRLQTLTATSDWQALLAAEDAIVANGSWRKGVPAALGGARGQWSQVTAATAAQLSALTIDEADQISALTLRTGNNQLLSALIGSLVALLVAVGAILWALRQSAVLVDRALSVRLSRLGSDADALIDERLPAVMDRLRRREPVDLAVEFAQRDYGSDEIGQVAGVLNRSVRAAAEAAVDEAKARAAGTAMLMGVARRPQRPLRRGLKVIEDLQGQIGDEKLLSHLFDIHHQLNQTRRFLENLVILAGGQIGRRFSKPMPLRRVLLASFAEAHNYQRISLRSATDADLVGYAVAEVIHLLAELLDNALAFSAPRTTVWVTAVKVNHGVAIEIEDAGVGMSADAVERANVLLSAAPTPEVTELKDGAQVGLYVVAELAKREGVQVSLRRSAYGGLLAIVLLPERLLVTGDHTTDGDEPHAGAATAARAAVPPVDGGPRRPDRAVEAAPAATRSTVVLLEPEAGTGPPSDDTAGGPMSPPAPSGSARTPEPAEATSAPAATKPPLPHRQPQQHLAPGLRDGASAEESTHELTAARSPEEARSRFAQYQRGRAAGRTADRQETETRAEQGRNA
ncbi:nitrate- and nitrite sensing domain-containing protein [Actinoplanes sp. NEAU-A12]|uniref:histidine kinase n=1 Tax=Actinoplanes sandaracinus TaxID=3045177 RepID=A0ABT6WWV9_9ACTN|nr:nitrate- and nitrite sensing domain-containing protein [Actinoplanes sandaracinus]MDI6104179.1 nitrate- and nitrite sensing domain-containing protein [Actinoplanes sandaracinus]